MKLIETWALPGVALSEVGALGVVNGVADVAVDAEPFPVLTARILTEYEMPLVSRVVPSELTLVITIGEAVVPPSVRSAQVLPSVEYWYLVIAVPAFVPAVNATERL